MFPLNAIIACRFDFNEKNHFSFKNPQKTKSTDPRAVSRCYTHLFIAGKRERERDGGIRESIIDKTFEMDAFKRK